MTHSPGERIAAALPGDGDGPVPDVVVEPDADQLARSVASALVARLAAAQAVHGTASVVLTGGGIGTAVLERVAALAAEPEHAVVDWAGVDFEAFRHMGEPGHVTFRLPSTETTEEKP